MNCKHYQILYNILSLSIGSNRILILFFWYNKIIGILNDARHCWLAVPRSGGEAVQVDEFVWGSYLEPHLWSPSICPSVAGIQTIEAGCQVRHRVSARFPHRPHQHLHRPWDARDGEWIHIHQIHCALQLIRRFHHRPPHSAAQIHFWTTW